jgi:hypothetical protein
MGGGGGGGWGRPKKSFVPPAPELKRRRNGFCRRDLEEAVRRVGDDDALVLTSMLKTFFFVADGESK